MDALSTLALPSLASQDSSKASLWRGRNYICRSPGRSGAFLTGRAQLLELGEHCDAHHDGVGKGAEENGYRRDDVILCSQDDYKDAG